MLRELLTWAEQQLFSMLTNVEKGLWQLRHASLLDWSLDVWVFVLALICLAIFLLVKLGKVALSVLQLLPAAYKARYDTALRVFVDGSGIRWRRAPEFDSRAPHELPDAWWNDQTEEIRFAPRYQYPDWREKRTGG